MTKMKTNILSSIAYAGGVWVEVTRILFLAMVCLTCIGVAISDLLGNLIFLGNGLCIPNIKPLESMVGLHGKGG